MSGVMLKTAIYGILRVGFEVLQTQLWWWGVLAIVLGLSTALFGVVFSAVQTDMKRLLAYSSIENIGLLLVGMGLALLFVGYGTSALAALALTAVLYHALNHAFFKSLLFLCTGAVLHATGERNLGKLGGLLRTMPWVGWLALVGALAAAGLPPLNGFVSEWLLLQSFLFTLGLPSTFVNMLLPVVAAGVALVAALGGYVMVKFFGVIFLGQPREPALARSHDAAFSERAGLVWLAAGCVLLGLFPVTVIALIDPVTRVLVGDGVGPKVAANGWLMLAPVAAERSSYSPLLFLLLVAARAPSRSRWCAGCTTAASAVRRRGTAAIRCSTRACRTPPRVSASRSARCSSRSSASTATCPVRSTGTRCTACRPPITSGTGCTCPWRGRSRACRASSACCSRAGSRPT